MRGARHIGATSSTLASVGDGRQVILAGDIGVKPALLARLFTKVESVADLWRLMLESVQASTSPSSLGESLS